MIINILTKCNRCERQNILTMDKIEFIGYHDRSVGIITKQKCKCGFPLTEYIKKNNINIE